MQKTVSCVVAMALGAAAPSSTWAGGVTSVDLIAAVGQSPPGADGGTISTLNAPFTDGNGKVGFTGGLTPSNNFVWYDTDIIWLNSDSSAPVLSGAEGTMGVSNTGGFIYSPSADGDDAVYGDVGLILAEAHPWPLNPTLFTSFCSRPTMLPNGVSHWVAGFANTLGGASQGRALLRRNLDGSIVKLVQSGDIVSGSTISSPTGIEFDYEVSDNGLHYITVADTTDATASDQVVVIDNAVALREGNPTGQGDNWQAFDIVSINDSGGYIITGDTNGAAATDEFIAYNGAIVVREGATLDGVTLTTAATLRTASINNLGRVAHIWGISGGTEILFIGDAADLGTSSVYLLKTGDVVDTDGDSVPESTIIDFEASAVISPGVWLSDHEFVYIEVTLSTATDPDTEAIIRVEVPGGGKPCAGDVDPAGGDGAVDIDDLFALLGAWGTGNPQYDIAPEGSPDGEVDIDDLFLLLGQWGPCP